MAIVAKKEEIFDQRDYPPFENTKAKKVRNFFLDYSSGWLEQLGFSGEEDIHLYDSDVFDCNKHGGDDAPAAKLDDHRLSILTGMVNLINY